MTEPVTDQTQGQTQGETRGTVRFGTRIGIDPGKARIGVARSDPSGMLATPVETVRRGKGDLDRIGALVAEAEALEVVVGLPRSLRGGEGPAAAEVRRFADRLARQVAPVPVRLCDERLTTVSAESMLRSQGKRGRAQRAVVDQAAAVLILQHALDAERGTGAAPGELVRQGPPTATDPDTRPGTSPDRSPDTGTQAGAAPSGRGDA